MLVIGRPADRTPLSTRPRSSRASLPLRHPTPPYPAVHWPAAVPSPTPVTSSWRGSGQSSCGQRGARTEPLLGAWPRYGRSLHGWRRRGGAPRRRSGPRGADGARWRRGRARARAELTGGVASRGPLLPAASPTPANGGTPGGIHGRQQAGG